MGGQSLPFVFQEQMVCLPQAHHPFPQGRSFYFNESTLSISPSKFGVNIPLMYPQIEEIMNIVVEEGVKIVFTSAGNPKTWTG